MCLFEVLVHLSTVLCCFVAVLCFFTVIFVSVVGLCLHIVILSLCGFVFILCLFGVVFHLSVIVLWPSVAVSLQSF